MTISPAPDVDRVLDRMGRSTIGYRSFPQPVEALAEAATRIADASETRDQAPPATLFGLIGDALPTAAAENVAAPPAAPGNPFMPALPTFAAPAAQGKPVRQASLAEMFRILLGDSALAPLRGEATNQDAVFPFRRR